MRLSGAPIGISGTRPEEASICGVVEHHDRELIDAPVTELADRDLSLLVLTDRQALSTALASDLETPILPVGVPESGGVEMAGLERAMDVILTGNAALSEEPVLRVSESSESAIALYDITVMTGEPARISEYAINRIVEAGEKDQITHVRSDGVVVATPLGSRGYAKRVGGPPLGSAVDGLAVVPVSPFSVGRKAHVVAPPIEITVEREEGNVEVFTDGRHLESVDRSTPVTVRRGGTVPVVSVDEKT